MDQFNHFSLLVYAIYIFLQQNITAKDILQCRKFLLEFVIINVPVMYGERYMTSNVHLLLHLADKVEDRLGTSLVLLLLLLWGLQRPTKKTLSWHTAYRNTDCLRSRSPPEFTKNNTIFKSWKLRARSFWKDDDKKHSKNKWKHYRSSVSCGSIQLQTMHRRGTWSNPKFSWKCEIRNILQTTLFEATNNPQCKLSRFIKKEQLCD